MILRALLCVAGALVLSVGVAAAMPRGTNGMLTFGRFNPAVDDTQAYVINPDGSHERPLQGPNDTGESPHWFSDGGHVDVCCPNGFSRIIDPDDGTYRDVPSDRAGLFNPCGIPSPDGALFLCETFSDDGSQNGIHVIRTSDGGGFRPVTSNPGGDDVPGSWSPNGNWIVFMRFGPDSYEGVFVVHPNGTGLKQILPPSVSANCCTFNWSPQGNEIAFSRHAGPGVHSSLWVMHSDGSGLRPIPAPPGSGCGGSNDDPSGIGCLEPAWSPDGTKIAFAGGHDLDSDGEIYIQNLDGTGLTQVTHTGGSQSPDWGTHPLAP